MKTVALTINGRVVSAAVEPRTHLADFLREHQNLTGSDNRVGIAASLAGLALITEDETASAVLVMGGFAVSLAGGLIAGSGRNELSQAVWWYNRTLATGEPPPDP